MAGIEPEVIEALSAIELFEDFAEMERLCAGAKALMAARVADSGAWRKDGSKSAAHFVANKTGTFVGDAIRTLETADRIRELPALEEAVREGKLSETQTAAIASAAAASPQAQDELIDLAQREGIKTLKERCKAVEAAARPDEDERYARIHKRRHLRHWTDDDGAFRLSALLTPDAGAKFLAGLEPFKVAAFQDARKKGLKEPYEAYGADALVAMAARAHVGEGAPVGPPATVNVRVDLAALDRGETTEGEICEIPGIGPIPVSVARSFYTDAFVTSILTDGTDIRRVSHVGRKPTARQKSALKERSGMRCSIQGCDEPARLEVDHLEGWAKTRKTELDDLDFKCDHHHYLKTYKGWREAGEPGARRLEPPPKRGGRLPP